MVNQGKGLSVRRNWRKVGLSKNLEFVASGRKKKLSRDTRAQNETFSSSEQLPDKGTPQKKRHRQETLVGMRGVERDEGNNDGRQFGRQEALGRDGIAAGGQKL